MPHKLDSTFFE